MLILVLGKIARMGNRFLSFIVGVLSLLMFLYSGYMLYETVYLDSTAYAAWDLLQYQPSQEAGGEEDGFRQLQEINPDVIGWLKIDGTRIDYPILHGEDNLQYAYTDPYGSPNLNGSIYLNADNDASFQDSYMIIYGHHMRNGGMFGDLDKFTDPSFFETHPFGALSTGSVQLDIHFFACVLTDAYENIVYTVSNKRNGQLQSLKQYIAGHAMHLNSDIMESASNIVAFSTCSSAVSYGRLVLFAALDLHETGGNELATDPIPAEKESTRTAVGHQVNQRRWALVNVLTVLFNLYLILPIGKCGAKYGTGSFSGLNPSGRRRKSQVIVFIIEWILSAGSIAVLVRTESFRDPMTLIDPYTPWMLLFMVLVLLIDWSLFFNVTKQPKRSRSL